MSVASRDGGDGSSITDRVDLGHGAFGEVAAVGDLPLVVHVGQDGADEADHGWLVGEDPHHPGAAFDLLVDQSAAPRGATAPWGGEMPSPLGCRSSRPASSPRRRPFRTATPAHRKAGS
jgi:hypothetical protein